MHVFSAALFTSLRIDSILIGASHILNLVGYNLTNEQRNGMEWKDSILLVPHGHLHGQPML